MERPRLGPSNVVIWNKDLAPRQFRLVGNPCCIRVHSGPGFSHRGDLHPLKDLAFHVLDRSDGHLKIVLGATNAMFMKYGMIEEINRSPEIRPGGKDGYDVRIGFQDDDWVFENVGSFPFSDEEKESLRSYGIFDLEGMMAELCEMLDNSKEQVAGEQLSK